MTRLFGTDGIRGRADLPPLDGAAVLDIGRSLAEILGRRSGASRILMGRDTRESGPRIARYLAEGIRRAGGSAVDAGVIPTPGVAYLTRAMGFAAGIVISASHNPYEDNGIKVFSSEGTKIPDLLEEEIERGVPASAGATAPREEELPALPVDPALVEAYLDFLLTVAEIPAQPERALTVVVDCSHGAASGLAERLFLSLGARVIAVGSEPNGRNINLGCGSQHTETLSRSVAEAGADLGIAYDGDADRCILVDEQGAVRDGDYELALFAERMARGGNLPGGEVVATVMSNIGLERFLEERGIGLVRAPVGDKYVLEEMVRRDAPLGGEQSGHIIFLSEATTGDGLLTSLKAYELLAGAGGAPLSKLAAGMRKYPQVLRNLRVGKRTPVEEIPALAREIRTVEEQLGREGRCLVRYSGTEPILRIMIEGGSQEAIEAQAEGIARVAEAELG